jgi:hypothetical protein
VGVSPTQYDPVPGKDIYEIQPEDVPPPVETSDVVPWVGMAILVAAMLLVVGWFVRRRGSGVSPQRIRDIRQRIADRPLPFSVCADCRIIIDMPVAVACPQCGQMTGCIQVQTEDDRSMAAAAVGDA